jgi:cysteine desulfurase/selenocysteine lyase
MDVISYKKEFPFTDTCIYLDNASNGPLPERSVEALHRAVQKGENPTLFGHEDVFDLPKSVRQLLSQLIGAKPEEIALTQSTGHGINIAANCLDLHKGEKVLLSEKEFPSNVYPWLNLRRKGIEVQFIPSKNGCFDIEAFRRAIDRRTKVLAISFVQFYNGFRNDLEILSEMCRENGIYFFVDGSQGVGAIEINVLKTPIDMLACCGSKWLLSPIGTGFMYISERLLPRIDPANVGWMSFLKEETTGIFEHLTDYDFHLPIDARKFEVGSPPCIHLSAFQKSLELILEIGVKSIQTHITGLLDYLIDFLHSRGYDILSSLEPQHRSTILSFTTQNMLSVHRKLREHKIFTSVREGGIRISPHFYNTSQDIDRLIEALQLIQ